MSVASDACPPYDADIPGDIVNPQTNFSPRIIAVVAATPSRVIGLDGGMPWRLRSDLRRFKRGTMGGVLLMGRKTFDSIGRPLPGRTTVVVTRQADWGHDGVVVACSDDPSNTMGQAIKQCQKIASQSNGHVYVVGGAQIYQQALEHCDEIWLTDVWSAIEGDTRLELDLSGWKCIELIRQPSGPRDSVPTQWNRLVRRRPHGPT